MASSSVSSSSPSSSYSSSAIASSALISAAALTAATPFPTACFEPIIAAMAQQRSQLPAEARPILPSEESTHVNVDGKMDSGNEVNRLASPVMAKTEPLDVEEAGEN